MSELATMFLLVFLFGATASQFAQEAPLSNDVCNATMANYFDYDPTLLEKLGNERNSSLSDQFYARVDSTSLHIVHLYGLTECNPFIMCIRGEVNHMDAKSHRGCNSVIEYGKEFACVVENGKADCVVRALFFGERSAKGFKQSPMSEEEFRNIARDSRFFQKPDAVQFSEVFVKALDLVPFGDRSPCRLQMAFINERLYVAVENDMTLKEGIECRLNNLSGYEYSTDYKVISNVQQRQSVGQCYKVQKSGDGTSKNYCFFKSVTGSY